MAEWKLGYERERPPRWRESLKLESIEASRWKKEVFFRSPLRHRWSLLFFFFSSFFFFFFFGELAGRMLGEAGLEKCGTRWRWSKGADERISNRQVQRRSCTPHQVSMETWHSLSGFSSFSSCSSFSSLLWLLFLSPRFSLVRAHRHRRAGSPEDRPRLQRTIFPRYFLQTEGKNYLVSQKTDTRCSPWFSIPKFLFSPRRRFSFGLSRSSPSFDPLPNDRTDRQSLTRVNTLASARILRLFNCI